jgi:hypothetical protein
MAQISHAQQAMLGDSYMVTYMGGAQQHAQALCIIAAAPRFQFLVGPTLESIDIPSQLLDR